MSFFEFPTEYDENLDPTPEDEEFTPRDLAIMLLNQVTSLNAANFNLWRSEEIPKIKRLLEEGVEQGGKLVLPGESAPAEIESWNEDGYSDDVVNFCVQKQSIRETAEAWRDSGNRLLRQSAVDMRKQWYMLPLPRLMADDEFRNRYLANGYANLGQIVGFTGRGNFQARPVYEKVLAEPFVNRLGEEKVHYQGVGVLDDFHQPITGTTMIVNVQTIVGLFNDRYESVFQTENNGFYRFLENGSKQVWDMDNNPAQRTEEWRPPSPEFIRDSAGEREEAWAIAKQLA